MLLYGMCNLYSHYFQIAVHILQKIGAKLLDVALGDSSHTTWQSKLCDIALIEPNLFFNHFNVYYPL